MFFELQMLNISSLFPPTCSNRSRFSTLYRLGWASKIALTTVVALGSIGLTAGEAHAFVVNVDSQNYDVTTFSGSYNDNISKFNLPTAGGVMPWWNSDATSKAFATAVGTAFGAVNPNGSGTSGPLLLILSLRLRLALG